ncbi:restriction endonuclease subunit S [Kitasatospora sp. McL0602]|uniref:restriction endonuclease subunit S n=1 Tax=Kitasatospora sp. McL0602 TaxID=3439530 RepID=UPI003F8A8FCC
MDWTTVRLADVLSERLVNGRSVRTREDGFPVLRLTALRSVTVNFTAVKDGDWTAQEAAPHLVEPNDLLVSRASGSLSLVGEGALVHEPPAPTAFPDTMIRVRVLHSAVNPRYLAHLWNSPVVRRQLEACTRKVGGGMYRITQSDLAKILLPLPKPDEQHRIVGLLEEYLARIDAAAAQARTAASRAAELSRLMTAQASLGRLSGGALAPRELPPAGTRDGMVPQLPADWRWTRLETIADVARGVTKDARGQWDPTAIEVPYLRVSNVQRGRLALDDVPTMRLPADRAKNFRLQPGDVLLTGGGDRDKLGRGWIWEEQLSDCVHQNHVFRVRVKDQLLHPKLLTWHANGFGRQWCERNATQSTGLASIGLGVIRLMPMPVPPPSEQQRLVELVEARTAALESATASAERALVLADRLRLTVLQHAFTGRLTHANGPLGHQESLL